MSASYKPAADARPVPPWSIAILSERDLSLRVPINFVTVPGVSLLQACFGHGVFENDAAVTCFSNLLGAGFRRFEWDLYWDVERRVWSFCPVQIPRSGSGERTSTTQMQINSATVTVSNAVITGRAIIPPESEAFEASISALQKSRRQDPGTAVTSDESNDEPTDSLDPTLGGPTTGPAPTTTAPNPAATAADLISLGPYSCSPSIDIPILAAVLASYFESTSNTLEAFAIYLTLNLHVAALDASTAAGSPNSTSLPGPQELISTLLNVNLTSYLYTPAILADERANVNSSWFSSASDALPLAGYFNVSHRNGESSSNNGWPNVIDLQFGQQRRLLAEFGQINPQMESYNFSADEDIIFPPSYLQQIQTDVSINSDGEIEAGCLYNADDPTIAANNNSWATYPLTQFPAARDQDFARRPITEVFNLTTCGISPYLNTSIFNSTADQDPTFYGDFVRSTTWSWGYGEPRNVSADEENASRVRCAAMDVSLNGRWRVVDCTDRHYAACRSHDNPFEWHISFSRATYTTSNDGCDGGQSFEVPLTPLENGHLFRQMQEELSDDSLIWVNFNSLDLANCWVAGVNTTCPYRSRDTGPSGREIIVPTVAAIIVLIVTALTVLVKCAANRQTNKRRRRRKGDDSWYVDTS